MKVTRKRAKELILKECSPLPWEVVTIENACGRVLAEDAISAVDIPGEDRSAVDGYAINTNSLREIPASFKVVGESYAGSARKRLPEGSAILVATGAPVPEGANAVVRVEDVRREGDRIFVDFPVEEGTLVNYKGEEIRKGEKVLSKGSLLDPGKIGILAGIGIYRVKVFQKPRIAVIPTGNEVTEPYDLAESKVSNSGFWTLKCMLEREGADVIYPGIVPDDEELLKKAVSDALSCADVVVTIGGVSKGKRDYVKRIVREVGLDVKFTSTNIRPGRPLIFATQKGKLFFGLPGYPSAMFVNALEFLLPAVRRLSGNANPENTYISAVAEEPLRSRKGRVDFVRVFLRFEGGTAKVRNAGSQRTANFRTMAECDALAIIEEERDGVKEGEVVEVLVPQNLIKIRNSVF